MPPLPQRRSAYFARCLRAVPPAVMRIDIERQPPAVAASDERRG